MAQEHRPNYTNKERTISHLLKPSDRAFGGLLTGYRPRARERNYHHVCWRSLAFSQYLWAYTTEYSHLCHRDRERFERVLSYFVTTISLQFHRRQSLPEHEVQATIPPGPNRWPRYLNNKLNLNANQMSKVKQGHSLPLDKYKLYAGQQNTSVTRNMFFRASTLARCLRSESRGM